MHYLMVLLWGSFTAPKSGRKRPRNAAFPTPHTPMPTGTWCKSMALASSRPPASPGFGGQLPCHQFTDRRASSRRTSIYLCIDQSFSLALFVCWVSGLLSGVAVAVGVPVAVGRRCRCRVSRSLSLSGVAVAVRCRRCCWCRCLLMLTPSGIASYRPASL